VLPYVNGSVIIVIIVISGGGYVVIVAQLDSEPLLRNVTPFSVVQN
jgi:hypothetical protein